MLQVCQQALGPAGTLCSRDANQTNYLPSPPWPLACHPYPDHSPAISILTTRLPSPPWPQEVPGDWNHDRSRFHWWMTSNSEDEPPHQFCLELHVPAEEPPPTGADSPGSNTTAAMPAGQSAADGNVLVEGPGAAAGAAAGAGERGAWADIAAVREAVREAAYKAVERHGKGEKDEDEEDSMHQVMRVADAAAAAATARAAEGHPTQVVEPVELETVLLASLPGSGTNAPEE